MRVNTSHDVPLPTAPSRGPSHRLGWGLMLALTVALLAVVIPAGTVLGSSPAPLSVALPSQGVGWTSISGTWVLPGMVLGDPLAPSANVAGSLQFTSSNVAGEARVAQAVNEPGSPVYHQYLSSEQFDSLFGPDLTQQSDLLSDLQGHGITVSVVSPFLWNVRGPVSAMDAAFETRFVEAVAANGHTGWAPDSPLHLPSYLAAGVTAVGAFQNAEPMAHTDILRPATHHALPKTSTQSHATSVSLGLNVTSNYVENFSGAWVTYTPTGDNVTYTLTITNGTAPYNVDWNWGDGTNQTYIANTNVITVSHMYYNPGQTDYCFATFTVTCENITVWAFDGAGDSGSTLLGVVPVGGPQQAQLFYNDVTLFKLGDTGAGTKIGLDEMCDPNYPTAQYMTDINAFSMAFGLPTMTSTTLQLVGSGNSDANCAANGGGSGGWSGETLLDMEWSHVFAPNATLVVDLSASAIDEGDAAWDSLSQGVFVDSNSWGCPYFNNTTGCDYSWDPWEQAAAQGQSFLTASGDCGSAGMWGTDPPTDTSFGLGVGATDYYPNPAGTYLTEYAWNGTSLSPAAVCNEGYNDDGSTGGYASGGQGNASIPAPWYQIGMTGFSSPYRGVPDVSALGGTWVEEYYYGEWGPTAGTSLASPSYAAMLDEVYDYNGTANKANGFIDNSLYLIAKSPSYGLALHDITIGENWVNGVGYNCTVGWSPVTGLGSPNIANLAEIMAERNGNPSPISPLTVVEASNATWGLPGLSVFFGADVAGGGNNALSGYVYSFSWGDGTTGVTGSSSTAQHVYTTPGWYTATVNVTEGSQTGHSNPILIHVTDIYVPPLRAVASANPTSGVAPITVQFTGGSTGGQGTPTFNWSFGDGKYSNLQSPSHLYTIGGSIKANLTVSEGTTHAVATVDLDLTPPLIASATATPSSGTAPLSVGFTSTVTGGVGAYTYAWTFGTQGTSAQADPSFTFNSAGPEVVELTVSDHGTPTDVAHAWANVTVSAAIPPLSVTMVGNVAPTTGTPAGYWATATGGVPGTSGYSYVWSWGDGTPNTDTTTNSSTHTYSTVGAWVVTVTVTDSKGNSKSASLAITAKSGSSSSSSSGNGILGLSADLWVLIAVIIVVVIILAVVLSRRKKPGPPPQTNPQGWQQGGYPESNYPPGMAPPPGYPPQS